MMKMNFHKAIMNNISLDLVGLSALVIAGATVAAVIGAKSAPASVTNQTPSIQLSFLKMANGKAHMKSCVTKDITHAGPARLSTPLRAGTCQEFTLTKQEVLSDISRMEDAGISVKGTAYAQAVKGFGMSLK